MYDRDPSLRQVNGHTSAKYGRLCVGGPGHQLHRQLPTAPLAAAKAITAVDARVLWTYMADTCVRVEYASAALRSAFGHTGAGYGRTGWPTTGPEIIQVLWLCVEGQPWADRVGSHLQVPDGEVAVCGRAEDAASEGGAPQLGAAFGEHILIRWLFRCCRSNSTRNGGRCTRRADDAVLGGPIRRLPLDSCSDPCYSSTVIMPRWRSTLRRCRPASSPHRQPVQPAVMVSSRYISLADAKHCSPACRKRDWRACHRADHDA